VTVGPDFRDRLERGAALFNERYFFEAHEVWEDQWRLENGEARRLLQGLIQVAAGFVKLQRGQPRGAVLNLDKGARTLAGLPAECFGVDLEDLRASIARWRAEAARMDAAGANEYDTAALPRLALERQPERDTSD
jgi:uncharacterized protein